MSLMSDLGTAVKNKLGGTSVTTAIPKYKDTNSTLETSGVTIDNTNKVIAPGGFSGALEGNANTATKLQTSRKISLSGDVSGNVNFDGSGDVTISTTIQANSVALGTDTTGNYVAGVGNGTGITVSGTAGEGWTPTISLSNIGTAGTYTKVTTNSQGQVTSGTALSASDIPSLDASKITSGIIDAARLPAYVDDVLEFANLAGFPTTGETGKIYIALDTNKTYRWSGSAYVYITSGAVDSVNAGNAITVNTTTGVVTVSHADTSSQASVNNSGRTYIQDITLDTYGHITGIVSATETAVSNVTTDISITHNAETVVVNSSDGNNGTINSATTTLAGVLSATDKTKIDGLGTVSTINTNASTVNYLRGDGTWVTPPNTTYSAMSAAELTTGTATTSRVITAKVLGDEFKKKADINHNHTISDITDLQTVLDGKLSTTGKAADADLLDGQDSIYYTNASNLNAGTIPDERLSGTYSGFTHKIDGVNTLYTSNNISSSAGAARTVYGLAEYKFTGSTATGAIVFIAPAGTSTIMHQLTIDGLLYNNNIVSFIVSGYRTSGSWSAIRKINLGSVDIQVRWGVTADGKNCLILGDVSSTWPYPHFSIVKAQFSYSGLTDAYCSGWSSALVTDLSAYTNISSTISNNNIVSNITGNAGTATKLQTTRTINGTNFDGTANIEIHSRLGNSIASASTTNIGASGTKESVHITGTTTINSFGVSTTGIIRTLIFDGALTINSSANIIFPSNTNILTEAGNIFTFLCENGATGVWRCINTIPTRIW